MNKHIAKNIQWTCPDKIKWFTNMDPTVRWATKGHVGWTQRGFKHSRKDIYMYIYVQRTVQGYNFDIISTMSAD